MTKAIVRFIWSLLFSVPESPEPVSQPEPVTVYRAYRRKFYKEMFHGVFTTIEGAQKALQSDRLWEPPKTKLLWKHGYVRVRGYGGREGLIAEENFWHYEIVPTPLDTPITEWQDMEMDDKEKEEKAIFDNLPR